MPLADLQTANELNLILHRTHALTWPLCVYNRVAVVEVPPMPLPVLLIFSVYGSSTMIVSQMWWRGGGREKSVSFSSKTPRMEIRFPPARNRNSGRLIIRWQPTGFRKLIIRLLRVGERAVGVCFQSVLILMRRLYYWTEDKQSQGPRAVRTKRTDT